MELTSLRTFVPGQTNMGRSGRRWSGESRGPGGAGLRGPAKAARSDGWEKSSVVRLRLGEIPSGADVEVRLAKWCDESTHAAVVVSAAIEMR